MKTNRLHRWVAFTLALVMLLPMITVPTFAKATGGIAFPEDAVWAENFENAASINDACTSWPQDASVKAAITDSNNKVFDLLVRGTAPYEYYLYVDKNNKGAITDYSIDEGTGMLTGTGAIGDVTYNVTGAINTDTVKTAATVNSCSGAAKKVYVVTGEVADAYCGFLGNVAIPAKFRNPAWRNADVDSFVIDMKLYLSVGAKGVFATQITGTKLDGGATRYLQPFKLTANGSSATLGLGDNGEMKKGTTQTLALGRWHKITVVIDKNTSVMDIYTNGVYAFTTDMKVSSNNYTKADGPVNIVANSFFIQYNRGSAPSNLAGTIQMDDIAFYSSYNPSVWSESFERSDVLTDYATTSALDAKIAKSATDAGDNVFDFKVRGTAPSPYYLWIDSNNKFPITNYSIDGETGKLTGDATANGLSYNVTGVINTDSVATAATVNSCSGTAKTVYIMTGEAADARGGFLGNVARPVYFKNPAWKNADVEDFVIDMDFYMAPGTKGNFATQINAQTVAGNASRGVQPFLISATGGDYATLTVNTNSKRIAGADAKVRMGVWNRITVVIDKETTQVSMYINGVYAFTQENKGSGSFVKIDEPVNLVADTFFIQYNRGSSPTNLTGTIQLDDISFYNSTQGLGLSLAGNDFDGYSNMIGVRPAANEGFARTPNTAVFAKDPTDPANTVLKVEVRGNGEVTNDYVRNGNTVAPIIDGKVTINGVTYTPSSTTVGATNVTLTPESGTALTGYQILTHSEADRIVAIANVGVAATPVTPAFSYATTPKVVMQTKYYLSSDMKGKLEVQGTGTGGWLNTYMIDATGTNAVVGPHNTNITVYSGGAVTVARGEWFTVHLVWDLVSGQQDVFVNGKFAYSGKYSTITNITVNANSWYPVKIMRNQVAQGLIYADDIKIFSADTFLKEPVLSNSYTEDFSAYKSLIGKAATIGSNINANATYAADPEDASNTVVKIPFASVKNTAEILMRVSGNVPVQNGFYNVTRNAETDAVEVSGCTVTADSNGTYTVVDGSNTYTGVVLTTKDVYNAYWGDDAIDKNWQLPHPGLSLNSTQHAYISGDYYLSADATGEFQIQAQRYVSNGTAASWLALLYVDAATGSIGIGNSRNHEVLNKGAWNNISLLIDLVTGSASLYVNNVYVVSGDIGDNLILNAGKISFAKLPRKQNYYNSFKGYILVDNFSVGASKDQTVEIEADKLMYVEVAGERYYTNRFFLPAGAPYVATYFDDTEYADMMTTVAASSVRVSSPSGLRFATQIDTEKLDALFALADADEIDKVTFGTLIAPNSYISTEFTKEALKAEGKKFLAVDATHNHYYSFDNDPETTHFVGSIVNMYISNIARDFAGRGYVTVTLKTGQKVSIYSDTYHVTNVKYVAQMALEDTSVAWGADALKILESFAAGEAAPDAPKEKELNGLNVLAIGDSLFQGAHNNNGEFQWINVLARRYNWNSTNLGIGGSTISYNPSATYSNASMYNLLFNNSENYCYGSTADSRYYNCGNPSGVKADVDIILLQAGSNDYGSKVQAPLGTIGSTDPSTFLGAWKLMVERLLEEYPNATVVMMTAWHNGDQSRTDGAKAIEYTSSVVDLYEELFKTNPRVTLIDSGDPEVSNVHMLDAEWKATYSHDAFHLNNDGMEIMADAMAPYLQKIAHKIRLQRQEDLQDTNVLAIGDSLFGGHSLADGEQWLEILAKQCKWNLTNLGANGWTVAYNPGAYADPAQVRSSMYNKLMTDANYKFGTTSSFYQYGNTTGKTAADVDIIFLEGGWNDFGWGLPLGTASDTDGSTYMGAVNSMVKTLLTTYPNAKVVLLTSWHTEGTRADGASRMDFVANGMKAVYNTNYATNERVYIVDAGDPAVSGIHMTDSEWAAEYAMDAAHLNAEGMKIMANSMLPIIWRIAQD